MTRVPFATREGMDAAGQAIWDEIDTSRGGVARNYAALLNNPQAAGALAGLGGYARFETPLPARIKALAILTAARKPAATMSGRSISGRRGRPGCQTR